MLHPPVPTANKHCRTYLITFGLIAFASLLILGNFKCQDYYTKLEAAKKEMFQNDFQARSIQDFQPIEESTIKCETINCNVTCNGDIKGLNNYLSKINCSLIALRIISVVFPGDELQSNWLEGMFNLSSITISSSNLRGIQVGAFNQRSVARVSEVELNDVQLSNLTEETFKGLNAIEQFTLTNRFEKFSGEAFLKPMERTLVKLVIKHMTNTATDPEPWLRGGSFPQLATIVFDGSNFGEYIKATTFDRLKQLSILMMNSCKITSIADGSFDFMMKRDKFFISLQNNELKQLRGSFLSSITSSRRLDIQNNPWNCTCELEHLVRVFKNYPQGFGELSKCSTPPHLAGKLLSETDLNNCFNVPTETTTALTTTFRTSETTLPPLDHTTASSTDSIFIQCTGKKLHFEKQASQLLELSAPDGNFKIISVSETSVRLSFEDTSDDLAVIWFFEQPSIDENGSSFRIIGQYNIGCQSELDGTLLVEELSVNQSYIFCRVKNGTKLISPFNCKPYFNAAVATVNENAAIWLSEEDKPIAIGVFAGSVVVSIFVGLVGMFLLFRFYPFLLKGSKQMEVENKYNGGDEVSVNNYSTIGPVFKNSMNFEAPSAQFRRFSTESGLTYLRAHNYEELDYYKKTNGSLMLANRVPGSPAPSLPKRIENVKAKTLVEKNNYVTDLEDKDDGYTSVV